MKHNTIKRALAGVLAVLCVAGYLPANVGTGGLFNGTAIVASATAEADGINFNDRWSSNSLPQPEWDSYTKDSTGHGNAPMARHYYLDNDISVGTVYLRPEEYATPKKELNGVQVGWFRRYRALNYYSSVYLCLNNHTINAGGKDMMTQVDENGLKQCHYESFVYGYYGIGGANDVITNANSMGINYGGTWVLSGLKLTNFANIAELSGNVRWSDRISYVTGGYDTNYYGPYAATLNMKNATATCVNGVKITEGNFNITDSVINASGNYAVKLVKGSFRINGNSEINGAVVLSDNQKISFSNGASLTGNVKIKFDGKTLNGSPYVFTSGAANANIPEGTFTSDEGYYFAKTSSGEWIVYGSTLNNVAGGVVSGVEDEYILTNNGSITFPAYTVKDTTGKTLTKNTDYTVAITKDGKTFNGTSITQTGTYVIKITGNGNYTGTLSKSFTVGSYGTATLGGYTFNTLSSGEYAIVSADDWNHLSSIVSSGNNCSNLYFKLMNDISGCGMIGNVWNNYFSGTFDGNGHTVTVSASGGTFAGAFLSIKNATIKNLAVGGSITANDGYAAGIAGRLENNNTIENCIVTANISGTDASGGIAGMCYGLTESRSFNACVFNGTITGGKYKGGIIGEANGSNSINNCLSIGNNHNLVGVIYNGSQTITNCYRTVTGSGGTLAYTIEYGNGIVSDLENGTEYVNGLKVYENAMEYNGVTYAPQNAEIQVAVNAPSGYTVKNVKYNDTEAERVGATQYKFSMPNTNVSVTAEYEQSLVTVTWLDANGNVIMTDEVQRNTVPVYSGSTPTKAGDAQYSYVFSGWSPALSAITANTTYTAQFEQVPNTYTVTWKNADGTTLETDQNVLAGTTPEYNGATPTKADDEKYSYTFKGWDKEISEVTGDVTYTAQFTKTPNSTRFSQNENTYTIHDSTGWEIFAELIADGTTFSGKTILLADDISTTKMAASSIAFSGTFDGQGHTLTLRYGSENERVGSNAAPFVKTKGCTIKNLHVDGAIYSSGTNVGGITANLNGTINFTNCRVSATIDSTTTSNVANIGGFTGGTTEGTKLYFTGCVFDGKLLSTAAERCGGFVGYHYRHQSYNYTYITNSLFAPTEVSVSDSACKTFIWRTDKTLAKNIVLSNAYYATPLGTTEGTRVYAVSADDNIQINYGTPTTTYSVSGITLYDSGITCNGTNYALNGKTINLSVATEEGLCIKGVSVNDGDVEVTDNQDGTYSFTMPAANATISAETEKLKYTITWQDEDGTELQSGEVEYGATPVYNGAPPTKEGNEQYTYTFSGWSDGSSTYGMAQSQK